MSYLELVECAKIDISLRIQKGEYRNNSIEYATCPIWEKGDQINLWTYWQGYQLDNIGKKRVDILLVGQDWGAPENHPDDMERIRRISQGDNGVAYYNGNSPTDRNLKKMFELSFGVDISKNDPGMRLFFTNYSLGYRAKGKESGGMTKGLMKMDSELFNALVFAVHPKIIICLGRLTYEVVSNTIANGYLEQLRKGIPLKAAFPDNPDNPIIPNIPVYGVAHCGAWGMNNVGGEANMLAAWKAIAAEYRRDFGFILCDSKRMISEE